MKKLLLIIAVLSYTISFSQDYIPMLEQGNSWNVIGIDGFGGSPSNIFHEATGTEEIINGVIYKEIDGEGCTFFREENGKVYAYNFNYELEYLIYDFTLEVGDIVDFDRENYACFWIQPIFDIGELSVLDRSTQFIAGEDRVVLEISSGFYTEYWIEGIGSTAGFYPLGTGIDADSLLTCFTTEGMTTFFNGYTECVILGIDDFKEDKITLHPNPVSDTSIVQFPKTTAIDSIKIFDLSGRLVKEETITENYYTINAMEYQSGLYFYQVFGKNSLLKAEKFFIK